MIVRQSGVFSRRVKKLHPAEKKALDNAVKEIIKDPAIREHGQPIFISEHNEENAS